MKEDQMKLLGKLLERRGTMDEEQLKLVSAAFLAGLQMCKSSESGRMPRVVRNRHSRKNHKMPKLPIRLDGERCAPETILRFNGMPLHWVLDKTAFEGKEMSVFSRLDYAYEFRKSLAAVLVKDFIDNSPAVSPTETSNNSALSAMASGILPMGGGNSLSGDVYLYEHADFLGAEWKFDVAWGPIPNFCAVYPTVWWTTNINDMVTSVENDLIAIGPTGSTDKKVPWAILWEHVNYVGGSVSIAGGKYASRRNAQGGLEPTFGLLPNVGEYWNDKFSSMSYEVTEV